LKKARVDNDTRQVYNVSMLRRLNIWLDTRDLKRLAALAKRMTPGTKVSQLIRQAISEYLERNERDSSLRYGPSVKEGVRP
jgi:hypothetical protein